MFKNIFTKVENLQGVKYEKYWFYYKQERK